MAEISTLALTPFLLLPLDSVNHFDSNRVIFLLCVRLFLPLLPSILAVLLKRVISTLTPVPFWEVRRNFC